MNENIRYKNVNGVWRIIKHQNASQNLWKSPQAERLARLYAADVHAISNTKLGRFSYTQQFYQWLVENNLYDNLVLAIGSDYGVLKNEVTGVDYVASAYDLSKLGNNLTQGSAALQPEIVNRGWKFDNDVFSDNSGILNEHTDVTWGLWLKTDTYTGASYIAISSILGSASRGLGFITTATALIFQCRTLTNIANSNFSHRSTKGWEFVIGMFKKDTSTSHLFRSGVLVSSNSNEDVTNIATSDLYIGRRSTTAPFYGTIGESFIIKGTITEPQALSLYNLQKSKYGL